MTESRLRIPRPPGEAYVFACTRCLLVYRDGVDYQTCVRCDREVDWVDERYPALACRPCNAFANGPAYAELCLECDESLVILAAVRRVRPAPRPLPSVTAMAGYALTTFLVVQSLFALLDPNAFPYLAPILVVVQLFGLCIVAWIIVFGRDIRGLLDHRTRIIHGLEHATIAILRARGIPVRSGVTYPGRFLIVIENDGRTWMQEAAIGDAAREAIRRVIAGEHALAYSVNCGTSYLVAICLFGLAVVGAGLGARVLGAPLGIMWAATVGAVLVARGVARRAGLAMQRWLTVSTDLANATVTRVDRTVTSDGDRIVAVVALDVVPRAREGGLVAL